MPANKLISIRKNAFFWILILALMVRVLAALYLGNAVSGLSGAQDEVSYSMLGQRYALGYGLTFPSGWYPWIKANAPQSYYSAMMSLYLAAIYTIFGYYPLIARIITGLLSTLIVAVLYLLIRKLFNEKTALFSALIAAGYAYLVFYGVTLVTETPFILGLLVCLYFTYSIIEDPSWLKWIVFGLILSITILFRMAVIFFVPFLIGWVVIEQPRNRKLAIIPFILIILAILPFTIRNYRLWNRFLLLEAQFGHVFWNGNHPGHQGDFHPYRVFSIPSEILSSNNDAEITNQLLRLGIQNVINDPKNFFLLTLTRLREFFKFWPTSDSNSTANLLRVFSFGIMWPFSLAGLLISRSQWRRLFPLLLFMPIHTGVYAISWTMIRYRIPLDAVLIPFAAVAIVQILESLQNSYVFKYVRRLVA
jgi:4-amino-4-deoxy-L-arabinose transferase-like glycosyltransferase